MKKMNGLLVLVFITAVTIVACSGGGGGGGGDGSTPTPTPTPTTQPWLGTIITSPPAAPIAAFTQSVASKDTGTNNEIFPGQANIWTIDQDFSLVDGFDIQFNYALGLTVGSTVFSGDSTGPNKGQEYSELTYFTPVMGTADGVKVAAVSDGASMKASIAEMLAPATLQLPLAGKYSAFLNATSDSRLQQTVDLTSATGTVQVSWRYAVSLEAGALPGYTPSFNVIARKMDGTVCQTLFVTPITGSSPGQSKNLISSCTGTTIVLSFEEKSMTNPFSQTYAIIDSVSVRDNSGSGTERLTNGDFEFGDLTGWTTNTPAEVQNITSGVRTLEGLDVRRSFYTVPNKLWARWVDVFENHTASDISRTITYETSLGSDGAGIIYSTPGTNNKALTSWDSVGGRDVGLVFGNAKAVNYLSDNGTGTVGSGMITVSYDITVPAGGRVALVNFVIMDGTDTGLSAVTTDPTTLITTVDTTAKATDIDTEAAKIVTDFWTDDQYRTGMTQDQIDAVRNMAN